MDNLDGSYCDRKDEPPCSQSHFHSSLGWLSGSATASPAPPAIALLGLLGMLAGEHGTVLALRHFGDQRHEAARANARAPGR